MTGRQDVSPEPALQTDTASPDAQSDQIAAWIGACANQDREAFRRLYDATGSFLYAVAFQLLHNQADAQDAMQEAFVQIWNNADRFDPLKGRPMTWLASIVRYRALDRCSAKMQSKETSYGEDDEVLHQSPADDDHSPQAQFASDQRKSLLNRCMTELDTVVRRCIELAYIHGHSREDIARLENTSENTVKSWLRRGAERLQLCVTRYQTQSI